MTLEANAGKVQGPLAPYLDPLLRSLPEEVARPLLFSSADLAQLDATQQQSLVDAYASGKVIALIEGQSADVQTLHRVLNLPIPWETPDKTYHLYAVRTSPQATETWTAHAPPVDMHTTTENLDDSSAPEEIDEPDLLADTSYLANYAEGFHAWLSTPANPIQPAAVPSLRDDPSPEENLIALAHAYVATDNLTFMNDTFQVSTFAWAVCAEDADTPARYWFAVEQRGLFNAAPAYTHDSDKNRGYYARSYDMSCAISIDGGDLYSGAILDQVNPPTTQNQTSVTTGLNWNIGGTVGFTSSGGGSASVTGGVSVVDQRTMQIPDVQVQNLSGKDTPSEPQIVYLLNEPAWHGPAGAGSTIGGTPLVGRSTFQPFNAWIWHFPKSDVPDNSPGVQIALELVVTLKRRYVSAARHAKTRTSTQMMGSVLTIPYPPMPSSSQS